jgi:hypothetical protein
MDFPEPLFETRIQARKICLGCAKKLAVMVLRTTSREIVPICADCAAGWNMHGYQILKRIKPATLLWRIVLFKFLHPFQAPSWSAVWRDISGLKDWAGKMRRWMK